MSQPHPTPERVSIRDIARSIGVSIMTVSLALRNNPKISETTRARVRQAADKLGYRPDPEIARLMTRLHNRRHADDAPTMAIVDFSPLRPPPRSDDYCERVRRGAVARAEELGYIASCFHHLDYEGNAERLLKVLHYRGIRGVLLLPPLLPVELAPELDWSSFSVLSATYAITPLQFHRVVPHQFIDMCSLIRALEARGHRRIGAVFETGFEERTHHRFTAAITLHGHGENILRIRNRKALSPSEISAWLRARRPDVLVCPFAPELVVALAALPADANRAPDVVSIGAVNTPGVPHWDERPELIGADAATLLAGMIRHNETGVPASPRTSMIHGIFHEAAPPVVAPTIKRAPAKAGRRPAVAASAP